MAYESTISCIDKEIVISMASINETFGGYLNIDNDTFVYNVTDSIVTLLPAESDPNKQYASFKRVCSRKVKPPEYLFGLDGITNIAFLRNNNFSFYKLGMNPILNFSTPVIIKAAGNANGYFNVLTDEWTKFHSITFYGGNINSIFDPQLALKSYSDGQQDDGTEGIFFKPYSDYTHSIEVIIGDKIATLTVSVYQSWSRRCTGRRGAHSLGELDALIRLSFETAQSFDSIVEYYRIIKKLISILTRRRNISFDTYLSQVGRDGKLYPTAVCKIFDGYENYADINYFTSIPIYDIFDCLPNLIIKIHKDETEPLLALLPMDNRKISKVSITNIQDLCTALEAAYPNQKREKVALITELKSEIKKTIKAFQQSHSNIDVNNETTLSNCFQHLDFTLRQKVLTMYNDNKDFIDPIISKHSLPLINDDTVKAFVNLRNNKTHGGTFEMNDNVNIYIALLAIVYVQLFKSIGIPNEKIADIIQYFF